MEISIRKAVSSDGRRISDLLLQLLRRKIEATTPQTLNTIFQQMLQQPNTTFFVAEYEGNIVGFLSLTIQYKLSELGKIAIIEELIVDDRQRSHGVGALLVKAAEQEAIANHCTHYEVCSHGARERAHKFYETHGFEKTGFRFGQNL